MDWFSLSVFHMMAVQVGLRCFDQDGVDVCVMEMSLGRKFDAINAVPAPVAC